MSKFWHEKTTKIHTKLFSASKFPMDVHSGWPRYPTLALCLRCHNKGHAKSLLFWKSLTIFPWKAVSRHYRVNSLLNLVLRRSKCFCVFIPPCILFIFILASNVWHATDGSLLLPPPTTISLSLVCFNWLDTEVQNLFWKQVEQQELSTAVILCLNAYFALPRFTKKNQKTTTNNKIKCLRLNLGKKESSTTSPGSKQMRSSPAWCVNLPCMS